MSGEVAVGGGTLPWMKNGVGVMEELRVVGTVEKKSVMLPGWRMMFCWLAMWMVGAADVEEDCGRDDEVEEGGDSTGLTEGETIATWIQNEWTFSNTATILVEAYCYLWILKKIAERLNGQHCPPWKVVFFARLFHFNSGPRLDLPLHYILEINMF